MNDSRYRWILYTIVFVILGTIGIQLYWNYKNYLVNKQQFINDVQISLDNAVDTYYANLVEEKTIRFAFKGDSIEDLLLNTLEKDSVMHRINFKHNSQIAKDSVHIQVIEGSAFHRRLNQDSILQKLRKSDSSKSWFPNKLMLKELHYDSLNLENFKNLTSRVIISLTNDTLHLDKIDTLLIAELGRKNLNLNHGISFKDASDKLQFINESLIDKTTLDVGSKSTYLPRGSILKVHFKNETAVILKRILSGILISIVLVLAVISCLFYLLKIIKHQKQLAEVKNDLISNITHEFKTPIATIGVALESIKDFKVIDDKEKTKQYLKMSGDQLTKLNVMVEKLLETATLDSDSLQLQKENINVVEMLTSLVEKHNIQEKSITIKALQNNIVLNLDVFHFENAVNNIIDNAIKYGGSEINITVEQHDNNVAISISDNGNTLTKTHKDKIFEQFYRVPKGNTHNIKGFGIGLYYSKKIIEKHRGTVLLDLGNNLTTFKISMPNV